MRKVLLLIGVLAFFSFDVEAFDSSHYALSTKSEEQVSFVAKDFSHLLGNVEGISDELLTMHLSLYSGYVKNANTLYEELAAMRSKGEDRSPLYGALVRRFAWECDGMVMHQLYFENIGPGDCAEHGSPCHKAIVANFGSEEEWAANFLATGMTRGIGWVVLCQEPVTGRLVNIWVDDHHINHIPGSIPLIVMDVWEHAYITEFGLDRAGYIKAFLKNINWKVVAERFQKSN